MPKKDIYVIGDIEMGAGNLTDDFISDKTLSELIITFAKKKGKVDLILNGDTFDFLKCPYKVKGKYKYPRHITETISLNKLSSMYKAHKRVFLALRKFVKNQKHNLYFIIGNHDHDLFFPGVQKKLRTMLKSKHNIFFPLVYKQYGVHVEHGHQYDPMNKIDPEEALVTIAQKTFLNLPEASVGLLTRFMQLKYKHHPFLERIQPRGILLTEHKKLGKSIARRSVLYFTQRMLGHPLRKLINRKARFPKELLEEAMKRIKKEVDMDVEEFLGFFKRAKKQHLRESMIYVFGHLHKQHIEKHKGYTILRADTWRDEYWFHKPSRSILPKQKAYVHVSVPAKGKAAWKMILIPFNRTPMAFDDVVLDEMKYLKQAAKEEEYKLRL